ANQGSLPALLPFLKTAFGLSYAAAGTVLLVANVTSSVIQPLFGYLSDRTARRWLLPWGLILASGGVALAGLAPSYGILLALLVAVVAVRSWTQLGVVAYVPFFHVDVLRADPRLVGPLLFTFLGAGAVGTLVGGPIADRWGPRRYITYSLFLGAPLLAGFLRWPGSWPSTLCLAAAGF